MLQMSVPTMGTYAARKSQEEDDKPIEFTVRVRKATLEANDHNHADMLKVVLDSTEAGCDPRLLRDAVASFFLANADDFNQWRPNLEDVRFSGVLAKAARRSGNDSASTLELEFHDYTALFLRAKPFGTNGIPKFSMNLKEAWRCIVSETPGADFIADRIVFSDDIKEIPVLGKSVATRFASLGKVPVKLGTDAWAVWQQCVGMCSLISYIYLDTCYVVTATDYYTNDDPPRLIWGKNICEIAEERNAHATKGIGLSSFDPLTGSTIEAFWPPIGDPTVKRKRMNGHKIATSADTRQSEERKYYAYPGVSNVEMLTKIAKRVYEESSRQELEGTLETKEFSVETVTEQDFPLARLRSGDAIQVEIDKAQREMLVSLPSESARISYLRSQGFEPSVAALIARNAGDINLLNPVMHVKGVETTLEVTKDGGSFSVRIGYCNRINITGDAVG